MGIFRFKLQLLIIILALTSSAAVALCQSTSSPASPATPDWETLRPENEDFSILMPKGSKFETSKEPYHKMELNVRTYLSNQPSGAVFAVVSISGIKSNPALYTEMQRVNSYVDAFKEIFAPKIRKGAVAKLSLVGDKTLYGHAGREYRMTVGDLTGTAQVYATRRRFYSVVYLNTKPNDAVKEEFLSSFVLPEKTNAPTAPPATVTTDLAAKTPEVTAVEPKPGETKPGENPNVAKPPDEVQVTPPQSGQSGQQAAKRPVHGGLLNSKALILPKPDYPPEASSAGIEGVVVISVTIDEQGNVAEAHFVSGPKALQQVSLNAALQAKFSPTVQSGEPVKVTGVLVFNFGKPVS